MGMDHAKYYGTKQRAFTSKDEIVNIRGGGNLANLWAVGGKQRSKNNIGLWDKCPTCGWFITGKFSSCPRCNADLRLYECLYCGEDIFASHMHCPHCTAPLEK